MDFIGETIAQEAPYAFAVLLDLYVDHTPDGPPEGPVTQTPREELAFIHGGMFTLMLCAAGGDRDLAHEVCQRLVQKERERRG